MFSIDSNIPAAKAEDVNGGNNAVVLASPAGTGSYLTAALWVNNKFNTQSIIDNPGTISLSLYISDILDTAGMKLKISMYNNTFIIVNGNNLLGSYTTVDLTSGNGFKTGWNTISIKSSAFNFISGSCAMFVVDIIGSSGNSSAELRVFDVRVNYMKSQGDDLLVNSYVPGEAFDYTKVTGNWFVAHNEAPWTFMGVLAEKKADNIGGTNAAVLTNPGSSDAVASATYWLADSCEISTSNFISNSSVFTYYVYINDLSLTSKLYLSVRFTNDANIISFNGNLLGKCKNATWLMTAANGFKKGWNEISINSSIMNIVSGSIKNIVFDVYGTVDDVSKLDIRIFKPMFYFGKTQDSSMVVNDTKLYTTFSCEGTANWFVADDASPWLIKAVLCTLEDDNDGGQKAAKIAVPGSSWSVGSAIYWCADAAKLSTQTMVDNPGYFTYYLYINDISLTSNLYMSIRFTDNSNIVADAGNANVLGSYADATKLLTAANGFKTGWNKIVIKSSDMNIVAGNVKNMVFDVYGSVTDASTLDLRVYKPEYIY